MESQLALSRLGLRGQVQEIAAQKDDTKRLQASFLAAESQRESEASENHATIVDLRNNLDTIKTAIYVLRQHQATAFPQVTESASAHSYFSRKQGL